MVATDGDDRKRVSAMIGARASLQACWRAPAGSRQGHRSTSRIDRVGCAAQRRAAERANIYSKGGGIISGLAAPASDASRGATAPCQAAR